MRFQVSQIYCVKVQCIDHRSTPQTKVTCGIYTVIWYDEEYMDPNTLSGKTIIECVGRVNMSSFTDPHCIRTVLEPVY